MTTLTSLPEWQALQTHHQDMANVHMRDLFQSDAQRFQNFSLQAAELFLDYSKNRITAKTLELLYGLAEAVNLKTQINNLLTGKSVNTTEQRPALHTALRNVSNQPILVNNQNIMVEINNTLEKIYQFSEKIRGGHITDVVNIGIGGSQLGPQMVTHALKHYAAPNLRIHFVSNVDGAVIQETLKNLNPDTTLFIISSKSFSTIETLTNAQTAKQWFRQKNNSAEDFNRHFVAVTERADRAQNFGIAPQNIFPLWEWVGGRYSLWSAIGLPILLAIGKKNFQQLLAGAHAMDQHFHNAPLAQNMPVILGLLDIWYSNFFDAKAQAVVPYDHALQYFPTYLQQVQMESLGKHTTWEGKPVSYTTGQIIFGYEGTDAQHSFFQLLHQGTALIPVDFIVPITSHHDLAQHHTILLANAFAQSKALMEGKNLPETHKALPGNRPSNTLLLPEITPYTLGNLLALYEHKTFVASVIWQINAFDQWGVEIGKQLADEIAGQLQTDNSVSQQDSSTAGLINYCHTIKKGHG